MRSGPRDDSGKSRNGGNCLLLLLVLLQDDVSSFSTKDSSVVLTHYNAMKLTLSHQSISLQHLMAMLLYMDLDCW